MSPLISIVIPTYEHAHSLPFCLESIFAQTYKHVEIIVIDDGSTDHTPELMASYADRVKYIRQENKGGNPARNRGFQEATGEYVIFCDADVVMSPQMLERMLQALTDHPEASYAYSGFKFGWKTFKGKIFDEAELRRMNFIHTTSLVRRADFPGFDESIRRLQDWDVWLSMLEQGKKGVLVPQILFQVRIDGASRIGSSWLPKFVYAMPWRLIAWKPERVKKYEAARAVIVQKHRL